MKTLNFNFLLIITIAFFSMSCDVLEQTPESEITQANFWKTPNDAESGLIAVNNLFMKNANRCFELGEYRSDNVEIPPKWGWDMVAGNEDINNNVFSPESAMCNWVSFYKVIARANEVLYFIEKIEFKDISQKNRILGEAYLLRAHSYFTLVKNWGAVPLIVEPFLTEGESMYVERTSVDKIYDQIVIDLDLAEKLLPTNRTDLRVRATKAAAQALFCDVLLTRGYSSFAKTTDFALAITKADAIIANTNYSLESGANYENIFRKGNSTESIFEIAFDYNNNETQGFCLFFLPRAYTKHRAYGGAITMMPSHSLVNSFESGDLRSTTTFTVLLGDEEKYYDNDAKGMTHGNKYLGTVTEVGVQRYSDDNIIVYRLSDVMLMKAEALIKTNKIQEALSIVNQIRNRAGLSAKILSTASEALDLLLDERRKELAFEGKRWYDLLRTGKVSVFRTEPEFIQGRFLLAVPQSEIDRNSKLLPQNPTY